MFRTPSHGPQAWPLVLSFSMLAAASITPADRTLAADKPAGTKTAAAPNAAPAVTGVDRAAVKAARAKAAAFLRTSQAEDGSWTSSQSPGITGLVTTALLRSGVSPEDPMLKKAFAHLSTFIQPDGGIYAVKSDHRNYETSICLLAYHAANTNGKHDKIIANARDFLKKLQWDDEEGAKPSDAAFGGAGYGKHQRPDLSNTSFFIDALKAAGVPNDDPAMKNAIVFISRCQNLESEHNTTVFSAKVNDGGFYYTPAAGGNSQAGPTPNGGLRSYASMTYAGLKSLLHAGVSPEDPRVKAAYNWIRKNYTVEENPGMGQQGLFYYYHIFAKALATMNLDTLEDVKGQPHDWRKDLGTHVLKQQRDNGSWLNNEARWMEGDPNLTTSYALLTLVYCELPTPKK